MAVCVSEPTSIGLTGKKSVRQKRCVSRIARIHSPREFIMNMHLSLAPIIALLAGILILVQPRLLNYIVAVYLIIIGVLGLIGANGGRLL